MIPNMFVGVGTGRCGTESLAQILDNSEGVTARHEAYIETDRHMPNVVQMMAYFREDTADLVGHVGALWLWFVPLLRLQFPGLHVVCLHRGHDETVRSFMHRDSIRRRKWLLNTRGTVDHLTPEFVSEHWHRCEAAMREISEPVFHLDTDDLNNDKVLGRLYDFLRIIHRPFPEQRRYRVGLESMPEYV